MLLNPVLNELSKPIPTTFHHKRQIGSSKLYCENDIQFSKRVLLIIIYIVVVNGDNSTGSLWLVSMLTSSLMVTSFVASNELLSSLKYEHHCKNLREFKTSTFLLWMLRRLKRGRSKRSILTSTYLVETRLSFPPAAHCRLVVCPTTRTGYSRG